MLQKVAGLIVGDEDRGRQARTEIQSTWTGHCQKTSITNFSTQKIQYQILCSSVAFWHWVKETYAGVFHGQSLVPLTSQVQGPSTIF